MNRIVKYAFVTNGMTGTVTAQIKIPGTFNGFDRTILGTQGRFIIAAQVEFGSPTAGDFLSNLHVEDIDGVIPASAHGGFPNYPIVGTRVDPGVSAANDGLYLSAEAATIFVPPDEELFIPSGLYLVADLSKPGPVADTGYVSIRWDDLS
jgi:hypothetical protein